MGKPSGAALGAPGFGWDEVAATGKEDNDLEGRLIKDGVKESHRSPAGGASMSLSSQSNQ
jgi:hypothetical protein